MQPDTVLCGSPARYFALSCCDGLQVVLFEIVRQCFVHCEDRGVLLERVRNRYLNLRHEIAAFAAGGKSFFLTYTGNALTCFDARHLIGFIRVAYLSILYYRVLYQKSNGIA